MPLADWRQVIAKKFIMRLHKVKRPKVYEPVSAKCSDHWFNVIVYGKCWKHGAEWDALQRKKKEELENSWNRV